MFVLKGPKCFEQKLKRVASKMPQINPASANSKGIPMRAPNARRVPILSPGDSAAVIHPRLLSESISKPPKEYIMPATIPIKQKSVA